MNKTSQTNDGHDWSSRFKPLESIQTLFVDGRLMINLLKERDKRYNMGFRYGTDSEYPVLCTYVERTYII